MNDFGVETQDTPKRERERDREREREFGVKREFDRGSECKWERERERWRGNWRKLKQAFCLFAEKFSFPEKLIEDYQVRQI